MKNFFYLGLIFALFLAAGCGEGKRSKKGPLAGPDKEAYFQAKGGGAEEGDSSGGMNDPSDFMYDESAGAPACEVEMIPLYESGSSWFCAAGGFTLTLNKGDAVTDPRYCCEVISSQGGRRIWNSENGYNNCDAGLKEKIEESSCAPR